MRALAIAATGMSAQQPISKSSPTTSPTSTRPASSGPGPNSRICSTRPSGRGHARPRNQNLIPEGAQVGLGTRAAAVRNLHIQGAFTNTGNKLDVALNGRGWFQVSNADGEQFYTRAGAFNKNATGQLVTMDGYMVQPAMTIPHNATDVVVNETGQVFAVHWHGTTRCN